MLHSIVFLLLLRVSSTSFALVIDSPRWGDTISSKSFTITWRDVADAEDPATLTLMQGETSSTLHGVITINCKYTNLRTIHCSVLELIFQLAYLTTAPTHGVLIRIPSSRAQGGVPSTQAAIIPSGSLVAPKLHIRSISLSLVSMVVLSQIVLCARRRKEC